MQNRCCLAYLVVLGLSFAGGCRGKQSPAAVPDAAMAAKAPQVDLPRYRAALKQGRASAKKNDFPAAVHSFDEALAAKPDDPAALAELGLALFLAKDLARARAATQGAIAKAVNPPQKAAALYNLGRIEEAQGHKEPALQAYRDSLALRDNSEVRKRLAALGGEAPAPAAEQDGDDFKMPCAQVLKLSVAEFTDVYADKTDDHSDSGEDRAAMYYADCEGELNAAQVKALPADLQRQIHDVDEAVENWERAYYGVVFFGGTLARHSANQAVVGQVELVAKVLDELQKSADPKAPPGAKLKARYKAELKRQRATANQAECPLEEEKENFVGAVAELKKALDELDGALDGLPVAVLGPVVDYLRAHCDGEDCPKK